MRLYCVRASLPKLTSYSSFIFDIITKSMTFFEIFFNQKYPFQKYDQIFVRDFQASAMENAGMVTFKE
jgi:aminopeptidase N